MVFIQTDLRVPEKRGRLEIRSEVSDGVWSVSIIGNPDGLRYLSDVLKALGDYDQDSGNLPVGERAHIHLHPRCQLGKHSCEVLVSRADAKGTGELPDLTRPRGGDKNSEDLRGKGRTYSA